MPEEVSSSQKAEHDNGQLRIGVVCYLNSRPLVEYLPQYLPGAIFRRGVPAQLADGLAAGELDVGLVPVVEWFRHPKWQLISDACVACRGKVESVKLFGRVPPERVQTVAADVASRTSVALTEVLLAEKFGIRPQIVPLELERSPQVTPCDAALVIGDRAMQTPSTGWEFVWDLGEQWYLWTGLPFVFAVWLARPREDWRPLEEALRRARDIGVARTSEICSHYAATTGLSEAECREYLEKHLWFYLDNKSWQGLELFRLLVEKHHLLPEPHLPPTGTGKC